MLPSAPWSYGTTSAMRPAHCVLPLRARRGAQMSCQRPVSAMDPHSKHQHSTALIMKSSVSVSCGLLKVLQGCVRPWYRSPSSHKPKLPLESNQIIITNFVTWPFQKIIFHQKTTLHKLNRYSTHCHCISVYLTFLSHTIWKLVCSSKVLLSQEKKCL